MTTQHWFGPLAMGPAFIGETGLYYRVGLPLLNRLIDGDGSRAGSANTDASVPSSTGYRTPDQTEATRPRQLHILNYAAQMNVTYEKAELLIRHGVIRHHGTYLLNGQRFSELSAVLAAAEREDEGIRELEARRRKLDRPV